jgi:hypothetical protein
MSGIYGDPELVLTKSVLANSLQYKMFNVSFAALGTLVFVIFS